MLQVWSISYRISMTSSLLYQLYQAILFWIRLSLYSDWHGVWAVFIIIIFIIVIVSVVVMIIIIIIIVVVPIIIIVIILIKSPQYTGGDFMFLYRFVRRHRRRRRRRRSRRRRRRRRPQILVHAITFEQLFGFLSFLAQLLALTCRLPDYILVDFRRDLDLDFSRSNMEFAISQPKLVRLPRNEKQTYRLNSRAQMWPSGLTLAMTLTLNFQGQI